MNRRPTYIYYILLFLTAVSALLPVVLLQHPLKYDIIDQAYPWKYFIGECLQEGMLPLWNPYQLLGSPIHADPQSSAWYPVTWFFGYFFGYDIYVLSVDFLLHIFLAGMGMFYLARHLKFRDETAFVMGVSFMLSGFFIGNAQHFMWIISGTWIPFILGAFLALKNNPSYAGAARLGLASFMIMTGGYPAFVFLLLYLLAAIFILFTVEYFRMKDYGGFLRYSGYLAVAVVFTVLTSMVVLVSVFHLQDAITRSSGVTLKQALFGAFTLKSFISFILPFASIRDMEFYGTDLSMSNAYFGLLLLVFFISALMIRRTKLINLFLFWGLFCLAASVGDALPLREFLYHHVPFMNHFRFPALFRVFFLLAFIIVAGYAFDEWRKDALRLAGKLRASVLVVAGVILAFVVYTLFRGNLDFFHFIKNQLFIFSEKSTIVQHILFQGIIQLILLLTIFLIFTRWKLKKFALAALLFIAMADMVIASRLNGAYTVYYQLFNSRDIYRHAMEFPDGFPVPDQGQILDNKDSGGLIYKALWRNLNIFHKQVSYEGYNPLHLKGFEEMADNHQELFETILQNPLVYLSAKISPLDSMSLHEQNDDYDKERIYLNHADYKMLKVEGWRLNEGDSVMLNVEGLMLNEKDSLIIKAFSPNEVKVLSKTGDKAMVNLLQNNYYGWNAKIDGQAARVYTGNMSFISVMVPAGEHEVVFYYDPRGVKVGLLVSLVSLILGITYLGFSVIHSKK